LQDIATPMTFYMIQCAFKTTYAISDYHH